MNIGNFKARLKAAGRTQKELADHLGVAPGEVSKYLAGKHKMSAQRYLLIEEFVTAAERQAQRQRGVSETQSAHFEPAQKARPTLSEEEKDRLVEELIELGDAYRRLPRATELSDDAILGYE